ncbi:MAG: nitroreductase family deazaflavin-dependent oxidoreductase [Anaerolineales bacterium]
MTFNVLLYRLSGGRLGSRMAGQSVLLLHTTGRKSGKSYLTPLNYYRDGDHYILVASNWGKDHHPDWFYNLTAQDTAVIQVKDRSLPVRARLAEGEEYQRLWRYVTDKNDFYVRYQEKTDRKIPLVILTPEKA